MHAECLLLHPELPEKIEGWKRHLVDTLCKRLAGGRPSSSTFTGLVHEVCGMCLRPCPVLPLQRAAYAY